MGTEPTDDRSRDDPLDFVGDREVSGATIADFLEGVEHRTLETRTEYTFLVGGTEILPARGAGAGEVLPERIETVVVKMLADRQLYDAL